MGKVGEMKFGLGKSL